jgi:predicted enzyme related to lactoylglutathione lyase
MIELTSSKVGHLNIETETTMTTMTEYPDGLFCWVDLVAHDLEAAQRWYAELFGWKPMTQDSQGGPPYVIFEKDGKAVAGAGQMSEDMKQAGVPPMWNDYVAVADASAIEAKAKTLGAKITVPTMQVFDSGKLCFLADPQGAQFAVWEAGTHPGAGLVNAPGSFAWNELVTPDVEAAKRFYGELFGWNFETQAMPQFEYTTIKTEAGRANGGMVPMAGPQWQGIPPHWMTYFAVEKVDDSLARVERSGGTIQVPATDIPGVGRFGVVADPQGATFTLLELSDPPA